MKKREERGGREKERERGFKKKSNHDKIKFFCKILFLKNQWKKWQEFLLVKSKNLKIFYWQVKILVKNELLLCQNPNKKKIKNQTKNTNTIAKTCRSRIKPLISIREWPSILPLSSPLLISRTREWSRQKSSSRPEIFWFWNAKLGHGMIHSPFLFLSLSIIFFYFLFSSASSILSSSSSSS